ncbi:MAG: HAD-IA family hydrolase [Anaerolineales bacterium]
MFKAIVVDIGGVILRTEDPTKRNKLEEKYGLLPGGAHELVFNSKPAKLSTIGAVSSEKIWQHVAQQLELAPQALEEFKNDFWLGDQIDHTLIQFLQKCRPQYKTALLSNAWLDARHIFAQNYGIQEGKTVDKILISSELGVAKPDPKIFHILSDTIDCRFDEMIFVDDFIENIQSAHALGITTIHYHSGIDLICEIKLRLSKTR